MGHFKIIVWFLIILLFSCNNKEKDVEALLSSQYDEMNFFYKKEASHIYLAAKDKTIDFPYLQESFDSITNVKNELDIFFVTYPNLKENDKLNLIFKTRKKINNLTNLKIKFIDEELLIKINKNILDKGINADFSKVYYNIVFDYYSKHCNKVH
jgi:hypothetical protein